MLSLEEKVEYLLIEMQDLRDRIADLEAGARVRGSAVYGPGRFPPKEDRGVTTIPTLDPSLKAMIDAYTKKHINPPED